MRVTITITILVLILVLAGALTSPANAVQIEALPIGEGIEIGEIINTIYKNALGLGGIAALVMITIGAVYFTLSGASPDKQSEGKNYITSALWGLLLLFGAFIILNTINPQITELAEPGKDYAKTVEETVAVVGGGESARAVCINLFEDCKAIYSRFDDPPDGYILKSEMRIPVLNCGPNTNLCETSINTRYKKMESGTQIQPYLLISGLNNLVQGCAVLYWNPTITGESGVIIGAGPGEISIGVGPGHSGETLCSNAGVPE